MKLDSIITTLELKLLTAKIELSREITNVYVSDLLSDVMANAAMGDLWITLQSHPNVVAVATLKDLSGIVLVNNRKPEEKTIKKANEEGIPVFSTNRTAFELAGKLYTMIKEK